MDSAKMRAGCFVLLLNLVIGGCATEYVIEYWASLLKSAAVDVKFGLCILLGLFLGQFMVPAAIATLIISAISGNPYYVPN